MITAERIKFLCPGAKPALVNAIVRNWGAAEAIGITTPLRVAHFMAQIATETGGLKSIDENLKYSAKRIKQVWPSRFKSVAEAAPYANNPEKLANKVYARKDLGNTKPGDGWAYRGGGFMQNTGRFNYRKAGYENNPDALRQPDSGFIAALEYWDRTDCNALADKDDLTALRKKINGGLNGIQHANEYLVKAKGIFLPMGKRTETPPVVEPEPESAPEPIKQPNPDHEPLQHTMPDYVLRMIQQRYRDLAYFEVGKVDKGVWGTRMVAATRAFQEYEKLECQTGDLTQETLKRLDTAKPRPVSKERAATTLDDLRASGEKIVKHADPIKKVAKWGLGGGSILATVYGAIAEFFKEAWDTLAPMREVFAAIPLFVWGLVGIGIAVYLYRRASSIEQYRLEDERSGKHAGADVPGLHVEATTGEK